MEEDTLRILFRLAGSPKLAEEMKGSKPLLKAKHSQKNSKYVISFDLCPEDLDWLPGFIYDHGIDAESYDIFISFLTERDTWIVDVPDHVVDLLRKIGGKVCFSATII